MQGIWFSTYGTNIALWSLGMEYWYYIVFALLMLPRSTAYAPTVGWAALALGVALFVGLSASGTYFLFGAFVWLLGALARVAPRPLMRSKWLALALWIAAASAIRLLTRGAIVEDHPRKEILDAINALLFANILLTLRFDASEGFAWCRARFHAAFADFLLHALRDPHERARLPVGAVGLGVRSGLAAATRDARPLCVRHRIAADGHFPRLGHVAPHGSANRRGAPRYRAGPRRAATTRRSPGRSR